MTVCYQKSDFVCPITRHLFWEPALAEDTHYYERTSIEEWLLNNSISPLTGLQIGKTLRKCHIFNLALKLFFEKNPAELSNRYDPRLNHTDFGEEVSEIIADGEFEKLYDYKNFDLETLFEYDEDCPIVGLIDNENGCTDSKIIEYVIDNIIDINRINKDGHSLMHYAAECATPKTIKYLLNKNMDLNLVTKGGMTVLHLACTNTDADVAMLMLDQNVDLLIKEKNGWTAMHQICRYQPISVIIYAQTKGLIIINSAPVEDVEDIGNVDNVGNVGNVGGDAANNSKDKLTIEELIISNDNLSPKDKIKLIKQISDSKKKPTPRKRRRTYR